jgi:coproporphyrinogen III oxidase-like Fe-S oxidoreductase
MYDLTQELCDGAGMPAYEVSNHARPGAESRHNLLYWRGGDYAGIGPGAHGRVTINGSRTAIISARAPADWLHAVETAGTGEESIETLAAGDAASEYLMMGLRINEGISRARFISLGGTERPDVIAELGALGFLIPAEDTLRTTRQGRMMLNEVLRQLLA